MSTLGRSLIIVGLVIAALGALLTFVGRVPWLGKLPGDVYYESERVKIYFPLATSIVVSIVLSLLFYLFRR
jgi:hypothetical protein